MLQKAWKRALGVAVVSMSLTGCFPEHTEFYEEAENIEIDKKAISLLYQDNDRLKHIVLALNSYCASKILHNKGSGYTVSFIENCTKTREKYFSSILSREIKVELSTELPEGVVVQTFKDRIIVNNYLVASTQIMVLKKAFNYMESQKRDDLNYGVGETFTIGRGQLINMGKFGTRQDEFLIPRNVTNKTNHP